MRNSCMAASRLPASVILVASAASWLASFQDSWCLSSESVLLLDVLEPLVAATPLPWLPPPPSPPPPALKQRAPHGAHRTDAAVQAVSTERLGTVLLKAVSTRRHGHPPHLASRRTILKALLIQTTMRRVEQFDNKHGTSRVWALTAVACSACPHRRRFTPAASLCASHHVASWLTTRLDLSSFLLPGLRVDAPAALAGLGTKRIRIWAGAAVGCRD